MKRLLHQLIHTLTLRSEKPCPHKHWTHQLYNITCISCGATYLESTKEEETDS